MALSQEDVALDSLTPLIRSHRRMWWLASGEESEAAARNYSSATGGVVPIVLPGIEPHVHRQGPQEENEVCLRIP